MWVRRPHSHHLHTYQMDLQQHEGTHDDLRLAGVAGGCRWSGQLDSACACPQVQVCFRGLLPWPLYSPELTHVAMGLPSSAFPAVVVVLTPTIFRLLRRWGLHYLPKLGLFTHNWDSG